MKSPSFIFCIMLSSNIIGSSEQLTPEESTELQNRLENSDHWFLSRILAAERLLIENIEKPKVLKILETWMSQKTLSLMEKEDVQELYLRFQ